MWDVSNTTFTTSMNWSTRVSSEIPVNTTSTVGNGGVVVFNITDLVIDAINNHNGKLALMVNITNQTTIANSLQYYASSNTTTERPPSLGIEFGDINFGVCNTTLTLPTFNFTFQEELNFTNLTEHTFEGTFHIWGGNRSQNDTKTFQADGMNSLSLCLNQTGHYNLSAIINYFGAGFDPRQYYFENDEMNTSKPGVNISLFSLQIVDATLTEFDIVDDVDEGIPSAFIILERYDPGTNLFHVMAMGKTNDKGEDSIFLRQDDALYKISVERNGSLQNIINGLKQPTFAGTLEKISSSPRTINILPTSITEILDDFRGITRTIRNNSNTIWVVYNDPSGSATKHCLSAIRRTPNVDTVIGVQCSTNSSGNLTISYTNLSGTYVGAYFASINPDNAMAVLTFTIGSNIALALGNTGIVMGIFLVMASVLAGSQVGLVATVVFPALILIGFIIMGVFNLKIGIVVSVIIMILFSVFKAKGK